MPVTASPLHLEALAAAYSNRGTGLAVTCGSWIFATSVRAPLISASVFPRTDTGGYLHLMICSCLPWSDCLAARLVCRHWSNCVAPLMTRIRVHVAAGCWNTPLGGNNPAALLKAAFLRLANVSGVHLLLTEHTSGNDFKEVLGAIALQKQVQELTIWEVMSPISVGARSYMSPLQLSGLQHVRTLGICSPCMWSQQDIWQQIAVMSYTSSPGTSGCQLETVIIHKAARPAEALLLPLPTSLPASIRHLTTLLPGIYNTAGTIVCSAPASHTRFIKQLSAVLPGLVSLQLVGEYAGNLSAFNDMPCLTKLGLSSGPLPGLHNAADGEQNAEPPLQLGYLQHLSLASAQVDTAIPFKLEWLMQASRLMHLQANMVQADSRAKVDIPPILQSLSAFGIQPAQALLEQVLALGKQLTSLSIDNQSHANQMHRMVVKVQLPAMPLANLQRLSLLTKRACLMYIVGNPAALWNGMPHLTALSLQGVGLGFGLNGKPLPERDVGIPAQCPPMYNPGDLTPLELLMAHLTCYTPLWLHDLPSNLVHLELKNYLLFCSAWQDRRSSHAVQQQQQQQFMAATSSNSHVAKQHRQEQQLCTKLTHVQQLVLEHCFPMQQVICSQEPSTASGVEHDSSNNSDSHNEAESGRQTAVPVAAVPTVQLLKLLRDSYPLQDLQLRDVPLDGADVLYIGQHLGQSLQRLELCPAFREWLGKRHNGNDEAISSFATGSAQVLGAAAARQLLPHLRELTLGQADDQRWGWWHHRHSGTKGIGGAIDLRVFRQCMAVSTLTSLKLVLNGHSCSVMCPTGTFVESMGPMTCHNAVHGTASANNSSTGAPAHINGNVSAAEQPGLSGSSHSHSSSAATFDRLCSCGGQWDLTGLQQLRKLGLEVYVPSMKDLGSLGPGLWGRCKQCSGGVGLEAVRWFLRHVLPSALPTCAMLYCELQW